MSGETKQSSRQSDRIKDSGYDPKYNENESTASRLLKFAGTWEGDDFEQCLEDVYKTRGETLF